MIGLKDASTMNCSIQDTLPLSTIITLPEKIPAFVLLLARALVGGRFQMLKIEGGKKPKETAGILQAGKGFCHLKFPWATKRICMVA
jgi:hypothetical protein